MKQVQVSSSHSLKVSVIIPVLNERATLARVIRNARKVSAGAEIIVIVNGSTDGSKAIAARSGVRVLHYDKPLGHDVGRAIGAMHASGDILLFLDADVVIPASKLRAFVRAVAHGVDIALNSYLGPTRKSNIHSVVLAKYSLNAMASRIDLQGASLTTIPHAISRRALETIGVEALAVPPLAQLKAIFSGLNVKPVQFINVASNPRKRNRGNGRDPVKDLIVGDHLEAISWLISNSNQRGNLSDYMRKREKAR